MHLYTACAACKVRLELIRLRRLSRLDTQSCNDLSLKFVILLGEIFRCAEEKLLKACGGRTAHK